MSELEQHITSMAEREKKVALDKLRGYFPWIFSGEPNTIRTTFNESSFIGTLVAGGRKEDLQILLLSAENEKEERIFLDYRKRPEITNGWQLKYTIEGKWDQKVTCIWQGVGNKSTGNLEISFEQDADIKTIGYNLEDNLIDVGQGDFIYLHQGFIPGRLRQNREETLKDAARIGNLLVLNYSLLPTPEIENTLVLPINISPAKFE